MRQRFKLVLFCLLFAMFFMNSWLFSQSLSSGKIIVKEMGGLVSDGNSGYGILTVLIKNTTGNKKNVNLELTYSGSYISSFIIEKKVEVMPNDNRLESLTYPKVLAYPLGTFVLRCSVEGEEDIVFKPTYAHSHKGMSGNTRSVLIDGKISKVEYENIFYRNAYTYGIRFNVNYFEIDFGLAENWMQYSLYDAVCLYEETFNSMPGKTQEAIFDYVRAGGKLIILGDCNKIKKPVDVRAVNSKPKDLHARYMIWKLAFGYVCFLESDVFGRILVKENKRRIFEDSDNIRSSPKKSKLPILSPDAAKKTNNAGTKNSFEGAEVLDELFLRGDVYEGPFHCDSIKRTGVNRAFESINIMNSDFGSLKILVFIFVLLLGPINFFWLHKKNKKIMVFVTVPILAFLCSVSVFAYYMSTEYWRLAIVRESLTFLDEETSKAVTFGGEIIFSGKSINNELSFPYESVVMLCGMSEEHRISGNYSRTIKQSGKQIFSQDWIKPKIPMKYSVTSITSERARVEIKPIDNENVEILNGLGADIEEIHFFKDFKRLYTAKNIKAGAVARATYVKNPVESGDPDRIFNGSFKFAESYDSGSSYRGQKVSSGNIGYIYSGAKNYEKCLAMANPGEYVAKLKSDPFLKQSFDDRAKIYELGCFVIGKTKMGSAL